LGISLLPVLKQEKSSLYISCIIYGFTISSIPVILAAAAGDAVGQNLPLQGLAA
jgi:hypothetical protein